MLGRKTWWAAGTLALVALCAGTFLAALEPPKDGDKKDAPPPKCDLAKIVKIERCHDCATDFDSGKCKCGKPKECTCKQKKEEVDVCEKIYYQCTECGNKQFKAGKCEKDGKKVEEKKSHADIIYVCEKDKVETDKPGKCKECKANLVKTCKESGNFPHVGKK